MGAFGDLDLRIDAWDVEYGAGLGVEGDTEPPAQDVRVDVEVVGAWKPIVPHAAARVARMAFVDGVRRMDVRVHDVRAGRVVHGAFGSFAVGSTVVEAGSAARFGEVVVGRVMVLGSGRKLPSAIEVARSLVYEPDSIESDEPDGPLVGVQRAMLRGEADYVRDLADELDGLIVSDGPLTFHSPRGMVVGYVKRMGRFYVGMNEQALLPRLGPGQRSPLFFLGTSHGPARYSWFLRLMEPARGTSPFSGVVRLEVADSLGVETARRIADATALALPGLAPGRHRDPRAPQNLFPIGALEAHLRRWLGDSRLVRRKIEALVMREVASGTA